MRDPELVTRFGVQGLVDPDDGEPCVCLEIGNGRPPVFMSASMAQHLGLMILQAAIRAEHRARDWPVGGIGTVGPPGRDRGGGNGSTV